MKNTWNGINSLINGKKKKSRVISSLKRPNDNSITNDPLEISNIFNNYFSSVGEKLASRVPSSSCSFTDYLSSNYNTNSFFFDVVSPVDIEREMLSIPRNKAYGLYSCTIHILSGAKHIISGPLSNIFNISVQEGVFPSKLKQAKVIPVYKRDDETEPGNYRPISLLSIFNRIFEKLMYQRLKTFLDNDFHNSSAKFSFFLVADDTNLLYADKNLKSLEETVNNELVKVSDWLNANKLTLNVTKPNFVIFRPYQRKMDHSVNIQMFDNSNHFLTSLECKDHVKYLGVLVDSHLS